jgi:hypothetical protein
MSDKQCTKCKETKLFTEFYKSRSNSGYRSQCKHCTLKRDKERYHTDPEYKLSKTVKVRHNWETNPDAWSKRQLTVRKSHLKRHYGMTLEQYQKLFEEQQGYCAICAAHNSEVPHKQLMVDHCHKTGKVRQLLCDLCNTALGKFKDKPELLEKAAAYLRKHNGES